MCAEIPRAILRTFWELQSLAVPDDADRNALDGEGLAAQVDFDRLELRVFGHELHRMPAAAQALHGDLVRETGYDDLSRAGLFGPVDRKQIALEDAEIGRAH